MNKKRRQELKQLKYKKRVMCRVSDCHIYVSRDGIEIYNPKTKDVIDDRGWLYYKNTSTPCSCSMCAYYKYKRNEQKIIDDKFIRDGLDEYYNLD